MVVEITCPYDTARYAVMIDGSTFLLKPSNLRAEASLGRGATALPEGVGVGAGGEGSNSVAAVPGTGPGAAPFPPPPLGYSLRPQAALLANSGQLSATGNAGTRALHATAENNAPSGAAESQASSRWISR